MTEKDVQKYDDIIHLPHPVSPKYPRMAAIDRAAQFSPFAALTGYEKALKETQEMVEERVANEVEACIDWEKDI